MYNEHISDFYRKMEEGEYNKLDNCGESMTDKEIKIIIDKFDLKEKPKATSIISTIDSEWRYQVRIDDKLMKCLVVYITAPAKIKSYGDRERPFVIKKKLDDWFVVFEVDRWVQYKCDQMEGLFKFLDDEIRLFFSSVNSHHDKSKFLDYKSRNV